MDLSEEESGEKVKVKVKGKKEKKERGEEPTCKSRLHGDRTSSHQCGQTLNEIGGFSWNGEWKPTKLVGIGVIFSKFGANLSVVDLFKREVTN
jgi:hypothetical protein